MVLAGLYSNSAFCQGARPLRAAIFAPLDSGASLALSRALTRISGIVVIPPEEIRRREDVSPLCDTSPHRLAMARSLKADLLILVDSKENVFAWIDCTTGEELFRIREETADHLARSAALLVEEQVALPPRPGA